jgi:PAS domain S-box-containing protein
VSRFTLLQRFSVLGMLAVFGVTGTLVVGSVMLVRQRIVHHDAAIVCELVEALLAPMLRGSHDDRVRSEDVSRHQDVFARIRSAAGIVGLIFYDADGAVLWADERGLVGLRPDPSPELRAALEGTIAVRVGRPRNAALPPAAAHDRLEEIYLPVRQRDDGPVLGVVDISREPPFPLLDRLVTLVWVVGGGGGLALYLVLLTDVRRWSRTQVHLEREVAAHARTLDERVSERTRDLLAHTRQTSEVYETMKWTKEHLQTLIDSSVDAIVEVDRRGRVTFASQGAQRMIGVRGDEIAGAAIARYWTRGAADLKDFRRQLLAAGRLQNWETELRATDGRQVPVSISASLLSAADGRLTGVLAIVRDVTDLRNMQTQMIRTERLAAAGLVSAGVAHEVGNPLTCIASLAEVLHAQVRQPAVRRGLEDIQVHVGRIEKIVQSLTQLARPAPIEFRKCSIEEIVQSAARLARHNPEARRMAIKTTFDGALPLVRVAPDQLLQVFLNLILNAAEAGGEELAITAVARDGELRIAFADTGHGMSDDKLRKLFNPFYSTKDHDEHMGLGLFVTHEIVRQHGGTILAASAPGSGSTFTVVLPVEA